MKHEEYFVASVQERVRSQYQCERRFSDAEDNRCLVPVVAEEKGTTGQSCVFWCGLQRREALGT